MKRQRFVHEFALLLLLAVAVGAIALQSNFNFTGFAIIGGLNQTSCEASNYTWENVTNEVCTNVTGCVQCETGCVTNYTQILCEAGCNQTCQTCENVTSGQCVGDVCDATHLSLCLTETTCATATGHWYGTPAVCNAVAEPTCDSSHSDLCLNQTACESASSYWYHDLCHTEEEEEDENETNTNNTPSTTLISPSAEVVSGTPADTSACTPNWQCGDWQECIEGTQTRICLDNTNCNTQEGIPTTSQPCEVIITETCSDKIKNQDEKGIDCGGVCKKCGFLTIVGNTISGQVEVGKNFVLKGMFGNVTKTIISVSSMVLVIAGIVCFTIFKKRRKK